jgi:hypothetical protein
MPTAAPATISTIKTIIQRFRTGRLCNSLPVPFITISAGGGRPPKPSAPVEQVAPFRLSVLLTLAEYATANSVPWIMDY